VAYCEYSRFYVRFHVGDAGRPERHPAMFE
jgi:hypothetical protein